MKKHRKGDIVTGVVPVFVDENLEKVLASVKFIGRISSYDAEEDLFTLDQAVVLDLDNSWNNIEGGISEYGCFIARLCNSEEFDNFHDGLKLTPTSASQYWSKIGTSLRLLFASQGESLFDD